MRKGFTLVEILIVIVVVGILTSMMTISMSASKISADASNIVTRLRNAKTAAMAMYVQYLDTWEGNVNDAQKSFDMAEVRKFLNNDKNYDNNYVLVRGGSTNNIGDYAKVKWYVAQDVLNTMTFSEMKMFSTTTTHIMTAFPTTRKHFFLITKLFF